MHRSKSTKAAPQVLQEHLGHPSPGWGMENLTTLQPEQKMLQSVWDLLKANHLRELVSTSLDPSASMYVYTYVCMHICRYIIFITYILYKYT